MYDAICGDFGIRANAIEYLRKAIGEAAHGVSDRDLQAALSELVKKKAIVVQHQTDTSVVGSVDGSGARKVNKRTRVYVPAAYDDPQPGAGRAGEDAAARVKKDAAEAEAAARGDETEDALQGRMDGMMAPAAPVKDGTPMGSVLGDGEDDGEDDGGAADDEGKDEVEGKDATVHDYDAATDGHEVDEDDISATKRELVDPDMDFGSLPDGALMALLGDAGCAVLHEAARAELDKRKG